MQRLKVEEIKNLVREVFPDFNQEDMITPQLIRQYIRARLPEDVLEETGILIPSRSNCWRRVEKVCLYLKTLNYWVSL